MANLFDGLQAAVYGTSTTVFGVDAAWSPSIGGDELTGRVLEREPTEEEKSGPVSFSPIDFYVEWYAGTFPGLFEAVRDGNTEIVTVGETNYIVRSVTKKFDGQTYTAKMVRTQGIL